MEKFDVPSLEAMLKQIRDRDEEFNRRSGEWNMHADDGSRPETREGQWAMITSDPVSFALFVGARARLEAVVRGLDPEKIKLTIELDGKPVKVWFSKRPDDVVPQRVMEATAKAIADRAPAIYERLDENNRLKPSDDWAGARLEKIREPSGPKCSECGGTGLGDYPFPCHRCQGSGKG